MNKFFVLFAALILLFGCTAQQPAAPKEITNKQPAVAKQPAPSQPAGTTPKTPEAPAQKQDAKTEPAAVPNPLANLPSALGWKVTYDMSGSTLPEKITMTQYLKGSKFRLDSQIQSIQTRAYVLDGAMTTCTSYQGAWVCYKSGAATKSADESLKESTSGSPVYDDGSMAVAGTNAKCYKTSTKDGNMRYCLSPEGVPLYMKGDGTSNGAAYSTETTASSYSMQVSDSDFALPAAASDMPAIPQGFGG